MRPVSRGQLWHHYKWGVLRVVGVFVDEEGEAMLRLSAVKGEVENWDSPLTSTAGEFRDAVSRGEVSFVRGPERTVSEGWPTDYEEAGALLRKAAREFYLKGGKTRVLQRLTRRSRILSGEEALEADRAQYLRKDK